MNGTNTNSTDDLGDVIAFVGNVVVSGSVLSGVAAIWVIGCLIHLKMIKKMAFRFLLYLMIADIFMSAAFFSTLSNCISTTTAGFWMSVASIPFSIFSECHSILARSHVNFHRIHAFHWT